MNPKWTSRFRLKPDTWVFVPTEKSIEEGNKIKRIIEQRWTPPKNYYHLRNGGHVEALRAHLVNTSFIHLDIQNFFGSINKTRVTRCLKVFFGYATAREMANASTVIHPESKDRKFILPFGFVQSPIIASLCLYQSALGAHLLALEKMGKATISVYVDDLVISTNDEHVSYAIIADIKHAADRAGFHLNAAKEEGPAEKITAFNIELSNKSMLIEPSRWDAFVESFSIAENDHQRRGILGYIGSVNSSQANELSGLTVD